LGLHERTHSSPFGQRLKTHAHSSALQQTLKN
jgi:hypothetical protein